VDVGINYQNDSNVIPRYYRAPNTGVVEPERISELKPLPLLPKTLSLNHDRSRVPPRLFYGFPLELSDAVRILKKVGYLERAAFPPDVSDKEAFLEESIATLFPDFMDKFIKILHKELGLTEKGVIPTFFADTVANNKDITLFTIGDSWRFKLLLPPAIIARMAHFLEKDVKKEDLPYYYLSANEDGIWRKPDDRFFRGRIIEASSGKRPIAMAELY
jgi:hypothetical protein